MDKLQIKFEGINFKPSQLHFPRYVLLGTYDKGEAEEVMARIIEFSQKEDQWVAVSVKDFADSIDAAMDELTRANEIVHRNHEKKCAYNKECRRLKNRIKALFGTKVPEPVYEEEIDTPVMTHLYLGTQMMTNGLVHLLNNHYLEKMEVGGEIYLKPTTEGMKRLEKFAVPDVMTE